MFDFLVDLTLLIIQFVIILIVAQIVITFLTSSNVIKNNSTVNKIQSNLQRINGFYYSFIQRFIKNPKIQMYIPVFALIILFVLMNLIAQFG
ncbi:MAG: hypothetical protein JJV93_01125 [Alphaproteobacteria bacterium]|nr:hypothetical protein [Alphaproteobacteria bacterium]MBL0717852.1 hypothetical protein [Alphaproteobacteria bacterium]